MEALLPSEIARLVLGYLQDQKCDEAARAFLKMSPHLQECRAVYSSGRRFSTRVNGLTLIDIFEKFSAANAIVQEKLRKVTDCEQLKHCGDLLEQLRFLVEESRGQRFVVNIKVPSQTNSQISGGSAIISSSVRKRHHSGSDRERYKRSAKSSQVSEEQIEASISPHRATVEATPLESLPGNSDFVSEKEKSLNFSQLINNGFFDSTKDSLTDCIASLPLETNVLQAQAHGECSSLPHRSNENSGEPNEYHESDKDIAGEKEGFKGKEDSRVSGKCMATDTEELTTYISTEVQTNPYDLPESETESSDELVENLSLLSKELLNRTELHERIADNINKAILPTELSFKDESLCESVGELVNTSVMLELNNAIKSIVEATETDPIFEKFFDEIVGPSGETDTSPDEEADGQVTSASSAMAQQNRIDVAADESSLPEPSASVTSKISSEVEHPEVPLKQRLRSSSVQQAARIEDDGEKQKERDKDYNALEHQNAAAILSIINANSIGDKPSVDSKVDTIAGVNVENESDFVGKFAVSEPGQCEPLQSLKPLVAPSDAEVANVTDSSIEADRKASKRHPVRKPKATRAKAATEKPAVSNADANRLISEQEMMAMPTLIVCSKEEVTGYLGANPIYNENTYSVVSASTSHFVPIAPKDAFSNVPRAMYLKTVNVQQKIPKLTEPPTIRAAEPPTIIPAESSAMKSLGLPMIDTAELPATKAREPKRSPNCKTSYSPRRGNRKGSRKSNSATVSNQLAQIAESSATAPPQTIRDNDRAAIESITLYGGENSAGTTVETADIPAISVEASLNICGSSLSPFLKFNRDKAEEAGAEIAAASEPREEPPGRRDSIENAELRPAASGGDTKGEVSTTARNNCDLISKRTPKSLLKSRSKNYRLSLSTPRRRSSHVRTLDFGTPMKVGSSGRRRSGNDGAKFSPKSSNRSKSVCRSTLFKSPPFGNSMLAKARKSKSPAKVSKTCRIPIATRSPAPKLMGGWERYTGVGMILGGTSPCHTSKSNSPVKNSHRSPTKSSQIPLPTSWDANLRKTRQYNWENESASTQNRNAETTKAAGAKRNAGPGERSANEAASTSQEGVSVSDRESEINVDKRQESGAQGHSVKSSGTEPVVQDVRSQLILVLEGGCTSDVASERKKTDESGVEKGEADARITTDDESKTGRIARTTTDGTAEVVGKTDAVTTDKSVLAANAEVKPKKYAKLKTIATNIAKREKEDSTGLISTSRANAQSSEILRISPEFTRDTARMPHTLELETPRKAEDSFGIPPTPRLLSPSSNIVTPFVKAGEEDSSKLRSYIRTPEFPPTPNIALTPKHVNENTSDAAKKGQYNACPSYYQPSSKKSEALSELQHCPGNREDADAREISKETITETYTASAGMEANDNFSLVESRDKLEITQFEVIKENLPREEAARELKISANSKDSLDRVETRVEGTTNEASATHEILQCAATAVSENLNEQPEASHSDSSSASGNESSESDSSSSSCSSSSSSSSSSCCSSMTNTSTPFAFGKMGKAALSRIYTDTSNESSQKVVGIEASAALLIDISPIAKDELPRKVATIEAAADVAGASESHADVVAQMQVRVQENEASPEKLMPAVEAEDRANPSNETPAKDEALLAEADISETPSSSKAGIESQTNLNSKITALIGSDDKVTSERSHLQNEINAVESTSQVLPKIVNVQRILPDVSIALKPAAVSETANSSAQSSSHPPLQAAAVPDGKLSLQLEEKRLRLMAKLKSSSRVDRVPKKPRGRPSALQSKKLKNAGTVDDGHEVGSGKDSMNHHKERPSRIAIRRSEERECRATDTTRAANGEESILEKHEETTDEKIEVKKKLPAKQDKTRTETTHNEKATSEKNTAATTMGSKSGDDEATKIAAHAKSEREIHKSDREAHENDDSKKSKHSGESLKNEVKDSKGVKRRESRRRKSRSREPEKRAKDRAERDALAESSTERNLLGALNDLNERVSRRNEHAEIAAAAEKSKCALKSKVDQVKRDLFSDDENNEQRTTRSRTRQISDAQKSDCVNCQEPAVRETISEKDSDVPEEDLPCVLESLELVPTAKADSFEDDGLQSANVSASKKLEYYFVYDEESAPTKRRKRRYSNSELEYSVTVELSDQDYATHTKVMRATAYEEMLNISPKPKKRGAPKKTVIKSSQNSKAGVKKSRDGKPSTLRSNQGKPAVEAKAATSKTGKVPAKASKKPSEKTSEAKTKHVGGGAEEEGNERSNTKVRKRRRSASQENEQIEKKSRLIDPQALLNKLDLEQFLTTLHGPT